MKIRYIICCLLFLFNFIACNKKGKPTTSPSKSPKTTNTNSSTINPDENVADGVTFIYSENAIVKSKLTCKVFIQNDVATPPFIDMLKGVHVILYDSSMKVESIADAQKARYYPQSGDILAQGNVIIVSKTGDTLKTSEMVWNQKLQKYFTEKQVLIIHEGEVTVGTSLTANKDFSELKITRQVGTISVDKGVMPNN